MTERLAFSPDWVSPPGDSIEEAIEARGWTQAELAKRLNVSPKFVNQLIRGKATLSADTACALSSVIGSTAAFWLRREADFRGELARRDRLEQLSADVGWLDEIPVASMARLGWIPKRTRAVEKVWECLHFFGVASVQAWRTEYEQPLAAYRTSATFDQRPGAVAAWLRRAEVEAARIPVRPFSADGFAKELRSLRSLTLQADTLVFVPELVRRCAAHGVAVVLVPTPEGCRASGATKWLTPDKALLVLSLRYKSDDHLWFSFFHEGAHLVKHGKKLLFIEGVDGLDAAHEREADTYAANLLIPPAEAARLRTIPRTADAVRQLAAQWGIAPGIVVGRMQHDGLLPHAALNDLKARYEWGSVGRE